jgi:ectoine hydroxylase-related dioxygenase (phytanoyl-CoA dioxygenase family)
MKQPNLTEALKEIDEKGYVEINNLLSEELLEKVANIIERPLNTLNVNGRKGYVQYGNIRYLANTLSWGKEIIDLYTHPFIIELCDKYAGSEVHLSNYRIYRTLPSKTAKMNWHLDNKTDVYDQDKDAFITTVVPMDQGIILMIYLSDVEDGGFQIVEGSHKWKLDEAKETWDNEEEQFKDKIVTFNNRKRGSVIVYDYRAIHRAKPYVEGKIRTSLFGQFSPSWMPVGEPILLNARDIDNLSETQKRVLNFGKIPSTENWPIGHKIEVLNQINIKEAVKYIIKNSLTK